MLKVEHITKDWKEAGSFPAQINLYGLLGRALLPDQDPAISAPCSRSAASTMRASTTPDGLRGQTS